MFGEEGHMQNYMGAGLQSPINWITKKWNINISFASYILFRGAGVKHSRTAGKRTEGKKDREK